ncbi:MAG: hypothetical protein K1Y36_24510 [Blastocatellia bacterium]|nr:hypothetical protein [Blastocatellia bacterium]
MKEIDPNALPQRFVNLGLTKEELDELDNILQTSIEGLIIFSGQMNGGMNGQGCAVSRIEVKALDRKISK